MRRPSARLGRVFMTITWAIVLAASAPAAVVVMMVARPSFLEYLVLMFAWGAAALLALLAAIVAAEKHEWRRLAIAVAVPLSFGIWLANFDGLWRFSLAVGECVEFRLSRSSYLAEIARDPASHPRLAVFTLSEDGWAGITNWRLAVYDESDEVALPDQSAAWKARARNTPLQQGIGYFRPLGGHFYVVRISY